MTPRAHRIALYAAVYPGYHPPSYWRILRVLRRMRHVGHTLPMDWRGKATFRGMIGRCLQIMARRRKVRR